VPSTPTTTRAEGAHPRSQRLIPSSSRRELTVGHLTADGIDHGCVVSAGMGVHPAEHLRALLVICHGAFSAAFRCHERDGTRPDGRADETVMGLLLKLL